MSFQEDPNLRLRNWTAGERLTALSRRLSAEEFVTWMGGIYGEDIPSDAFATLQRDLQLGLIRVPAIEVGSFDSRRILAAWDAESGAIQVSANLVTMAGSHSSSALVLEAALAEELGHYLDHVLRNHYSSVGGDASADEGAKFSKSLLAATTDGYSGPFAQLEQGGRLEPLVAPGRAPDEALGAYFDPARIEFDARVGDKELAAEAGHYYTTYLTALKVGYSAEQARELAFFSQVPDEIEDFDAIQAQARFLSSESSFRESLLPGNQKAERERNAVQGGIHSLTGGSSKIATEYARRAVLHFREDNAAAGVAIHRLADSFFHRVIGDEEKIYEPGTGHLFDWLHPDTLIRRPELYESYVTLLAETLAERRGMADADERRRVGERIARDLSPAAGVIPELASEQNDEALRAHSNAVLRGILERESQRRVDRGEDALDVSFKPEEHSIGIGKTTEEFLAEVAKTASFTPEELEALDGRIEKAIRDNLELYVRETGGM